MAAAIAHALPVLPSAVIPLRKVAVAGVAVLAVRCFSCGLRKACLPCGLDGADIDLFEDLVHLRRRVLRGRSLYCSGDTFASIYAVRSGFFKTTQCLEDGRGQVTGFHMAGELLGLDGIDSQRHGSRVEALEDSEVCVIPYAKLVSQGNTLDAVQSQLRKAMGRELMRELGLMLLLGTMSADERVGTFLLDLSLRLRARGYSPTEFVLRMTREEIASYLGLQVETVSRAFSGFRDDGVIEARQRHIRIPDLEAFRRYLRRKPAGAATGATPDAALLSA